MVRVWLGARITLDFGSTLNPVPEVATPEIVMFSLPATLRVTSCDVEVPITTLPKLSPEELGES